MGVVYEGVLQVKKKRGGRGVAYKAVPVSMQRRSCGLYVEFKGVI